MHLFGYFLYKLRSYIDIDLWGRMLRNIGRYGRRSFIDLIIFILLFLCDSESSSTIKSFKSFCILRLLGGLLECCDELFSASDDSSCLVSLAERLVDRLRVLDFGFDFFFFSLFLFKF